MSGLKAFFLLPLITAAAIMRSDAATSPEASPLNLEKIAGDWRGRLGCESGTYDLLVALTDKGSRMTYEMIPASGNRSAARSKGSASLRRLPDSPWSYAIKLIHPPSIPLLPWIDATIALTPDGQWLRGALETGPLAGIFGLNFRLKVSPDNRRLDYTGESRVSQTVEKCRGIMVAVSDRGAVKEIAHKFPCPEDLVAYKKWSDWTCGKKKDLVVGPPKNPYDPCPAGTWWHLSFEACTPIVCTPIPNDKMGHIDCPPKHHLHKTPVVLADSYMRPLQCVQDYSSENLETGGMPRNPGDCNLCMDSSHDKNRFAPLRSRRPSRPAIATPAGP